MTSVAIIVLNWKQPDLTIATVESLLDINSANINYKIFLVDNNSPDNSFNVFLDKFKGNKKIKLFKTKKNLGYAGGNNFGIKKALKENFDFVLLANNDIFVDKNFLSNLVIFANKHNEFGILGPKIYFAPHHEFYKNRYTENQIGKVIWSVGGKFDWKNILGSNLGVDEVDNCQFENINDKVDFISGCCMLINSKVFKKIGFLDQKYFMYLEDVDICQRAKRNNFKLAYIPDSIIWHINSGSSSSGSQLHDYFITRNRLLFGMRYASLRAKFALIRESIRIILKSDSKWKKQAVFDFYFKKFGKGSWL